MRDDYGNLYKANSKESGIRFVKLIKCTPEMENLDPDEEWRSPVGYKMDTMFWHKHDDLCLAHQHDYFPTSPHCLEDIHLYNSGARKCHIRTTCTKRSIITQPVVPADDSPFEPEIFYFSGPLYIMDIGSRTHREFPSLNTPTESQELNSKRGSFQPFTAEDMEFIKSKSHILGR